MVERHLLLSDIKQFNFTDSMDLNSSQLLETVKDRGSLVFCSPWGKKKVEHEL